jgi:hypothetical protein
MTEKDKIKLYEQDGIVGAYYALNRKLNEISGLLNNVDLSELDLTDKDDKTMERVMKFFSSIGDINESLKKLKIDNNLSGDEEKDKARQKPLIEQLVK